MTRLPAAARRAFALAAGATVVLTTLSVIALVLGLRDVRAEVGRATAVTTGVVVENHIGDEDNVRVEWTGEDGHPRRQVFGVYYDYPVGAVFEVRYDPHDPHARAYPADEEETDYEDGYYAGLVAFPGVAILLLLGLGARWWWWVRALGREVTTDVPAALMTGSFNGATSTWVRLRSGDAERWQQVMWDPAVDAAPQQLAVTVHGDLEGRRRLAVVLPDGSPLVGQGRLRHREPSSYDFAPRAEHGSDLAAVLVLPQGASLPAPGRWWRTAAFFGLVGAVLGGFLGGVVFGQGLWPDVSLGLALAALGVNAWTFGGGEG